MRIEADLKLDFKDVLIRPKRSTLLSRSDVSLERSYVMRHSHVTWSGVPIISANMDTTGTFEIALVLGRRKMYTTLHKHYSIEQWREFFEERGGREIKDYIIASSGIQKDDLDKLDQILTTTGIQAFCIDVANGYSQGFVETLRSLRKRYPDKVILAGNVVTGEMTEELILSGADIVKVGIGPGSVCTTRKLTGVGYPQLSAVIECADAAHGLGGLIISDGGCNVPGDIAKAFGAGADFVMLGGMMAGHDESSGSFVEIGGLPFKTFYGMSSETAMKKYCGGVAEYRTSEGKTVTVPYRGPVDSTAQAILGGLRSACTYVGASQLKELSKRTTFIRVTQQTNPVFDSHASPPFAESPSSEVSRRQSPNAEGISSSTPIQDIPEGSRC